MPAFDFPPPFSPDLPPALSLDDIMAAPTSAELVRRMRAAALRRSRLERDADARGMLWGYRHRPRHQSIMLWLYLTGDATRALDALGRAHYCDAEDRETVLELARIDSRAMLAPLSRDLDPLALYCAIERDAEAEALTRLRSICAIAQTRAIATPAEARAHRYLVRFFGHALAIPPAYAARAASELAEALNASLGILAATAPHGAAQ